MIESEQSGAAGADPASLTAGIAEIAETLQNLVYLMRLDLGETSKVGSYLSQAEERLNTLSGLLRDQYVVRPGAAASPARPTLACENR